MLVHHDSRGTLARESGRLGRGLFVSGAGLLSFSSVGLMRREDSYLEVQGIMLLLFVLAAALTLAGEIMRAAAQHRTGGRSGSSPEAARLRRARAAREAARAETLCDFCGKGSRSAKAGSFNRCLSCGKTACGRCSDLKGKEMGRDSRRCPGCGSQTY